MKFNKPQQEYDGPSLYLKIQDGEAITTILRGEIHSFMKTWRDGKTTRRYSVNAVVSEAGKLTPKIWEISPTVYGQLADINEVYQLETIKIRVKRTGTELETVYNILPLLKPEDQLTPQILAQLEAMSLNILDKPQTQKAAPNETGADNWNGF